jgi:tripartite-type tricarboxylate transporter receptor subunit TctC
MSWLNLRSLLKRSQYVIAVVLALVSFGEVRAQSFPEKRVTYVVPFNPGGGIDILARAIAQELTSKWGQPVIIENKPGAATFLAADYVARAPADGYTLFVTTDPTFTVNQFLFAKMPYDPQKSFVPVIQLVRGDSVLVAHPSLPVSNLQELVAFAKREKGRISYGSYGQGTQPHLNLGLMNKRENIDLVHVPYKSIANALTAVMTNEVQITISSTGSAAELIRAGKVKPIAVLAPARTPGYPHLASSAEQGYAYLKAPIWYGVFAPSGTPRSVVAKIHADVKAILERPDFAEKFVTSKGMTVSAADPDALDQIIKSESLTNSEMVRAADIKIE